ncbi:sensor histidine kinase [Gimesia algae]|uniref:histidine kinase n=1 Tax=Gimesia algae TaxID=2527971 RepID=A0A517VEN8_9PLAN|nr:ATP-binding protein [Gimesia algae]QDT91465.1 Sensor histidine kinase YycG [Gimesia algae]
MKDAHTKISNPTAVGVGVATLAVLVTVMVTTLLYNHTVNLLTDNLRERLLAIVTTQAANIDVAEVEALQVEGDWQKPEWARLVKRLQAARDRNSDIVYIYLFRRNRDDPRQLEFVTDAGSLNPYANYDDDPTNDVDNNGDGLIEPDDADYLQWPGQEYPDPPAEAFLAFEGGLTNEDLYEDAWGRVLTGYEPIRNEDGETVAVLAVDMKADDFFTITRQTLYPFTIFVVFLILMLVCLAGLLIAIWHARVKFLQQLDREKDELIGIVSHQLVTPISSVRWSLEEVIQGEYGQIPAAAKAVLQTSGGTVRSLLDVATLLLDVSRIELGRLQMEKTEQNLQELFAYIIPPIQQRADEKGVTLNVSLPARLPSAKLDRRLTHMTIENLLSNAVKYTPQGGTVDLTVTVTDGTLHCRVQDTGIGIPKQDQTKLFGKLVRASNVEKVEGNGFGLYVAKGAIEQQGGKIRFESTEGQGTTFYVDLPL